MANGIVAATTLEEAFDLVGSGDARIAIAAYAYHDNPPGDLYAERRVVVTEDDINVTTYLAERGLSVQSGQGTSVCYGDSQLLDDNVRDGGGRFQPRQDVERYIQELAPVVQQARDTLLASLRAQFGE